MTAPLDDAAIRDLLPAYALGALEPDERAQVAAALAANPDLRAELSLYDDVVEGLALIVPQVAPPPALRSKIMAQTQPAPKQVINWRSYLPAAAVLVALLAVLIWQVAQPSNQDDRIATILGNPQSEWIKFNGTEKFADVAGDLVIAPNQRDAVLVLENLAPAADASYQLWFVRDATPISTAVFQSRDGKTEVLISLPTDFETYEAFGVTIEPEGGSELPTGERVFGAPFPHANQES